MLLPTFGETAEDLQNDQQSVCKHFGRQLKFLNETNLA